MLQCKGAPETNLTTRAAIHQAAYEHLKTAGYVVKIDDEGDVILSNHGIACYMDINDKDIQFFKLTAPVIHEIKDEADRPRILRVINDVNRIQKFAKLYVNKDGLVFASIETIVPDYSVLKPLLGRALVALRAAVLEFQKHVPEPAEAGAKAQQ